ncbi:MAG: PepSY domain-containing protein [Rhizobium sp.]
MKHHVLTATMFFATFGSGAALAEDDCNVPMADWQPRNVVQKMAEYRGWVVQRIKTDDGCYEIRARDAEGRDIEVKVNPATLEIVDMEVKNSRYNGDHEDEDEDDDDDNRPGAVAPSNGITTPTNTNPPSNGLFKDNKRPTVVVK